MKLSECLADIGRPVAYYPSIARAVGSVKAGIFISQIIYWHGKGDGDGWFYKSVEELTDETGLSYKEQRAARTSLAALGVLEEFYNREEHRLYFRLNADSLDALWAQFQSGEEQGSSPKGICPKVNRHMPKSKVPPAQKSDGICPKVISYRNREYTETTTESTQREAPPAGISQPNIESPLAMSIRKVCKKGIVLSSNDTQKLMQVLHALSKENATVEQVEEFGRKVGSHWIGRDGKTKQRRAPGILQVLENWHDVMEMDEPKAAHASRMSLEDMDAIAAQYAKGS